MTLDQIPFPEINASLNGLSAVLLLAGYACIKSRAVRLHIACMLSAFVTSATFLGFYLTYHYYRASRGITITHFPAGTWWRPVYLAILSSHTILAVVILPLIFMTLWRAFHKQWHPHRKIALVTFPLWMYVSITGVVVYGMLYRLAPTLRH